MSLDPPMTTFGVPLPSHLEMLDPPLGTRSAITMTSASRDWVRIELEPRNYDGFPPYPHVLFSVDLLLPDEPKWIMSLLS